MRLDEFLRKADVSVTEFAAEVGISPSYIYQMLKKEFPPNFNVRNKIDELTAGFVEHAPYVMQEIPREISVREKLDIFVKKLQREKEIEEMYTYYVLRDRWLSNNP